MILLYDPIIGKIVFINLPLSFMLLPIDEITYFVSDVFSIFVSIFILLTLLFSEAPMDHHKCFMLLLEGYLMHILSVVFSPGF